MIKQDIALSICHATPKTALLYPAVGVRAMKALKARRLTEIRSCTSHWRPNEPADLRAVLPLMGFLLHSAIELVWRVVGVF
jgi:hypothetical protein